MVRFPSCGRKESSIEPGKPGEKKAPDLTLTPRRKNNARHPTHREERAGRQRTRSAPGRRRPPSRPAVPTQIQCRPTASATPGLPPRRPGPLPGGSRANRDRGAGHLTRKSVVRATPTPTPGVGRVPQLWGWVWGPGPDSAVPLDTSGARPEEAAARLLRRAGRDARRALAAARWRDVCGAGGAEAAGRARPARRGRGLLGWRRSGPCFVESGGCHESAA